MRPTDATLQNTNSEITGPDFTESDKDARPPLALQGEKNLSFFTLKDVPEVFNSHWLVKGIIPLAGIGIVYGEYASGKTFFVIDLALAIAGGQDFFGRKVKQSPVLYFCLEGKEGFINRLAAWKKIHEAWPTNIQFNTDGFNFFELKDDEISRFPKKSVIIIDTLNATDPTIEENTSSGMGRIISQAKNIQKITDGLILFIHHCGKDPTKGARGHSSLMGAVDVGILITSNGTRTWKIEKNKDGKKGISGNFTLREIPLGNDEDGEPITSCVIEPCETPEAPAKELSPALQGALISLEHALSEAGTDEISIKKWQEKWEQECCPKRQENSLDGQEKKGSERGQFWYRRQELLKEKIIIENEGMVRISGKNVKSSRSVKKRQI